MIPSSSNILCLNIKQKHTAVRSNNKVSNFLVSKFGDFGETFLGVLITSVVLLLSDSHKDMDVVFQHAWNVTRYKV